MDTRQTAYRFEDSSKTCYQGYKDGGKYTWTNNSSYSVSGSKISTKYGTFTIQNGGKKLQDSLGGYWIKA